MVNGIINIYKEKGFTSFDVVAKMRGIFHQKKIGHTGTLDPDAEGVLPVCLGKATKVCDLLTDKDKEYEAVLLLGIETDTQDISGTVINEGQVKVSPEEVREAILSFVGPYEQLPPMYSALKVNGQKLCDLARKGVTVERKPRPVEIFRIDILDMKLPEVRILVHCSKGTYIRTLCKDIGDKLGCFGCMKSLLRTRVSVFSLENAIKLSELEELVKRQEEKPYIHSVDQLFLSYKAVAAKTEAQKYLQNGNRIPMEWIRDFKEDPLANSCKDWMAKDADKEADKDAGTKQKDLVRLYNAKAEFVGIYTYVEEKQDYKPVKIFMEQDELYN